MGLDSHVVDGAALVLVYVAESLAHVLLGRDQVSQLCHDFHRLLARVHRLSLVRGLSWR